MKREEVKRRQLRLISVILELIALCFLEKILGNHGTAYFAAAAVFGLPVWCIMGNDVAEALSNALQIKRTREQYQDAQDICRSVLKLQLFLGAAGGVLLFAGGWVLQLLWKLPYGKYILWLLIPAFFCKCVEEALLGSLFCEGGRIHTAILQFLRPLLWLVIGFPAGRLLEGYGKKVSALLGAEDFTAMYAALGIALAVSLTELVILLALLLLYQKRSSVRRSAVTGRRVCFSVGIGSLYGSPLHREKLFLALAQALSLWLGAVCYLRIGGDSDMAAAYGIYAGKYLLLCTIALLLTSFLQPVYQAKIIYYRRKQDMPHIRGTLRSGMRRTIVSALYPAMLVGVLSPLFAELLEQEQTELFSKILLFGAPFLFLVAIAWYFSNSMLLLLKKYSVLLCCVIAAVGFAVVAVGLLYMGLGILALVLSAQVSMLVYIIAMDVCMRRQLSIQMDWIHMLAIPAGCICVIGVLCLLLGKLSAYIGVVVTLLICVTVSMLLYGGVLYLLQKKKKYMV